MSSEMAKGASATLPVGSRPNLEWRHKSLQLYVSPDDPISFGSANPIHQDATLSFATIALAMKVPRMADAKAQQVAVVIWGVVLFGVYSFLLSVFKAKNAGYPFFLPPF